MLKSILAQLEFTHIVRDYARQGVPLDKHLHVPEDHPVTGSTFCEREDNGHVLKVSHMLIDVCSCSKCMTVKISLIICMGNVHVYSPLQYMYQ